MRFTQMGAVFLLGLFIFLGCKKTPTDSGETEPPQAAGSYIGWGRPGGTGFNVLLSISESASSSWTGSIAYAGSAAPLTITDVSSDEDSIRFEYVRATTYRCLGLISNVAITIIVLEPAGQPTYVLNRERGGYNLSGEWNGWMYSQFLNTTEDAELFMDHQGSLYDGDVQSSFGIYTLLGNINAGAQAGAEFSFWGVAPSDGDNYPLRFDGTFINRDSVNGEWKLTAASGSDAGTFAFRRRF